MAETDTNSETATATRGRRRRIQGVVRSTKMDKTVVVEVSRRLKHPKYHKYINQRERYVAHDEQNACKTGDRVEIASSRPLSRRKRWRVSRIVERSA